MGASGGRDVARPERKGERIVFEQNALHQTPPPQVPSLRTCRTATAVLYGFMVVVALMSVVKIALAVATLNEIGWLPTADASIRAATDWLE